MSSHFTASPSVSRNAQHLLAVTAASWSLRSRRPFALASLVRGLLPAQFAL